MCSVLQVGRYMEGRMHKSFAYSLDSLETTYYIDRCI